MENIFFIRTTNLDYADLLNRPIIKTDNQIKKSEEKRLIARRKRKKKLKLKK